MRVAVLDIGSNSTRAYVADVSPLDEIRDLFRRSTVTRLADGLERTGQLNAAAIDRVIRALDNHAAQVAEFGAERAVAVLTSAVRDAGNGQQLSELIETRYGIAARTIPGELEAQLTFRGATSGLNAADRMPTLVIDIGGGSTELIVGQGTAVDFATSIQAGVVRQSERHLHGDPPGPEQLAALRTDMGELVRTAVPAEVRSLPSRGIAVAGTATSAAAIDQALEPYDANAVHGYRLELATLNLLLARLAAVPLEARKQIRGMHPDRAGVVVAGVAMLCETLQIFGLSSCLASEHDILRGVALALARAPDADAALDG